MKIKICLAAFIAFFILSLPLGAQSKLNIVTTTEDLAAIAREVGGDHITVDSIAKGYQDASLQARILEVPQGQITRAEGDVHPLGNPHYWLDPENGKIIAREIFDKLVRFRGNDRAYFEGRLKDFLNRLSDAEKRWVAMMAPYKGTKVVTYHRSFPNFAERFGLDIVGYVEPKPGIPPTPQHTLDLLNDMKRMNVKLVLVEPYFDLKTPTSIGRATGAEVMVMPPSVGGVKEVTDYFKLFDYDLNLLSNAIKKTG